MAERLREVSEELARCGVDFLCQQTDVVDEGRRPLEHRLGPGHLVGERECLGQPERAEQERALLALEPVDATLGR